jgi:bifunctional non-homologous end joining protein LigD
MPWHNARPRQRKPRAPQSFIDPCLPTKADNPPAGDDWAHEIKHDGYRIQIHTGGTQGPCIYTMSCWTNRYPLIVSAAAKIKVAAIIDAEAAVVGLGGITDFEALHGRELNAEAMAYASDLMMLNGENWRSRPWLDRRKRLKRLLVRRPLGLAFNDHHVGDGPAVFAHAGRMGLEGIVSKRIDAPYRSGKSSTWLKNKKPQAPAALRRFKEDAEAS